MQKSFNINTPFDRHGHLRELKTLMSHVLEYTAAQFWGMVVMPNLTDPIVTWQQAEKYREEITYMAQTKRYHDFKPVMTAYLTDNTDGKNIEYGYKNGTWKAAKLYPFGATTNSDRGVTRLENIFRILEIMQDIGMPLLVHPETDVMRHNIGFLDRERVFTEESLVKIHHEFPSLIMSVEHVTTIEACQFVEYASDNVVCTVTPQHIMYDYNAIFHGGVPPYKPGVYTENMCLPTMKYPRDVMAIRHAIMHGKKKYKFGAGTDTAPHPEENKQKPGSCCGCFNATNAIEFYAMVFDEMEMLNDEEGIKVFNAFMSVNNLHIYGLQPSTKRTVLEYIEQTVPESIQGIRPFKAGQKIPWRARQKKDE